MYQHIGSLECVNVNQSVNQVEGCGGGTMSQLSSRKQAAQICGNS